MGREGAGAEAPRRGGDRAPALGKRLPLLRPRGQRHLPGHDRRVRRVGSGPRGARADRRDGAAPLRVRLTMAERLEDIVRNNVAENLAKGEIALSMQVRLVESIEIAQI